MSATQMYLSLWGGTPWFNVHEDRKGAYYGCCCCSVFVARPTERASVAQGIFWWVRAQGRSPHAPSMAKNTFGLVGRRQTINPTLPKGVKAWGTAPWGRRKSPAAETQPARSVPQPAQPAQVRPDNWRSTVLIQLLLSVYFDVGNTKKAQGLEVWGGGEGSGLALSIYSKGT